MGLCFSIHYFEGDPPDDPYDIKGVEYPYLWDKPYFGSLGRYFLSNLTEVVTSDDAWFKPDWWKVKELVERALLLELREELEKSEGCCVQLKSWQLRDMLSLIEAIETLHNEQDLEKCWVHWSV